MNNLYSIYLEKKSKDDKKILLFKSGKFYYLLGEDAKIMNKELSLKLTKFSKETDKCGFPVTQLKKYTKFFSLLGYEYELVLGKKDKIIEDLKTIDINEIDGNKALKILKEYKEILNDK